MIVENLHFNYLRKRKSTYTFFTEKINFISEKCEDIIDQFVHTVVCHKCDLS